MSLTEIYEDIAAADEEIEKIAAQEALEEYVSDEYYEEDEDTVKIASEYDAAGRILARGFFEEMLKEAAEEAEEGDKEEEEDEEEKDKKKKKKGVPPALQAMMEEKKAFYLDAMRNDPEYADQLIAHFTETE